MADVQYAQLYLPDGTPLTVVVGSQLHVTLLASGATTYPITRTAVPGTETTAPDVRTPVATIWFNTPFGPQPITAPDIIDEYRRRDYAELTAAQAAAFYASGAEIPDVSYVTGVELPAAMATVAQGNNAFTAAQRAAFGSADPVLSDFVYATDGSGNLLSYKEDGIPIVLTYNADGTVATSKRGDGPTRTFGYGGGNLAGVA